MTAPLAALEGLTNTIGASPAAAVAIVIGLLLVFFGRNLFWIFVAGMGFLAGLQLAPTLVPNQPGWIILLIGIGLGLVGALLSIFLQRLAVALAGGYAGGLLALRLATELGWTGSTSTTVLFIAGFVIAAIIISLLYDWALIILTAITGALLICDALPLAPSLEWLLAAVLIAGGAIVQSRSLVRPAPSTTVT